MLADRHSAGQTHGQSRILSRSTCRLRGQTAVRGVDRCAPRALEPGLQPGCTKGPYLGKPPRGVCMTAEWPRPTASIKSVRTSPLIAGVWPLPLPLRLFARFATWCAHHHVLLSSSQGQQLAWYVTCRNSSSCQLSHVCLLAEVSTDRWIRSKGSMRTCSAKCRACDRNALPSRARPLNPRAACPASA